MGLRGSRRPPRAVVVLSLVLSSTLLGLVAGQEARPPVAGAASAESLLEEARSQPETDAGREKALRALRRLQEEFPERAQDPEIFEELERRGPYGFASLYRSECSPHLDGREIHVSRRWLGVSHPDSTYVARRVSVGGYRKLMRESTPGALPFPPPAALEPEPLAAREVKRRLILPAGPGLYVVEETLAGFRKLHLVTGSDYGLFLTAVSGRALAFAFDPETGAPLEGVQIEVLRPGGRLEARTGADGLLHFECPSRSTLLAWRGDDLQAHVVDPPLEAEDVAYITTDRPVYRAGETVRWKAVLRARSRAGIAFLVPKAVRVELRGPEGGLLEGAEHSPSPEGTIAGEFRLDAAAAPGAHAIVLGILGRPWRPWGRLDVLETRGALVPWRREFQVAAAPPAGLEVAVQLLDAASPRKGSRLRIEARRTSGEPAAGAEVVWSVRARSIDRARPGRDPVRPLDSRLWLFETWGRRTARDVPPDYIGDVDGGVGTTGQSGILEVAVSGTEVEPILEVLARAEVKDPWGAEGRGDARRRYSPRVLRITAGTERRFCRLGARFPVLARVTDLGGRPQAGVSVLFEIVLNLASDRSVEQLLPRPRGVTDSSGTAAVHFSSRTPGWYRVRASVVENAGLTARDETAFWNAGSGLLIDRPGPWGGNLDLVPDREVYEEGESAEVFVRSSFSGSGLLLVEGPMSLDARVVQLGEGAQVVPVGVPQGAAPAARVHLRVFRGEASTQNYEYLHIFPRRRLLEVQVLPARETCAPSETLKVEVRATQGGTPLACELELSVVAEPETGAPADTTVDIRRFFTSRWDRYYYSCGTCMLHPWDEEETIRRQGLEEAETDLVETCSGPLAETLLWLPRLATGPEGRAEVEVKAPARRGRFRITARAVSGADRFGQGQAVVRVE